jgi:hypothetical protein
MECIGSKLMSASLTRESTRKSTRKEIKRNSWRAFYYNLVAIFPNSLKDLSKGRIDE